MLTDKQKHQRFVELRACSYARRVTYHRILHTSYAERFDASKFAINILKDFENKWERRINFSGSKQQYEYL